MQSPSELELLTEWRLTFLIKWKCKYLRFQPPLHNFTFKRLSAIKARILIPLWKVESSKISQNTENYCRRFFFFLCNKNCFFGSSSIAIFHFWSETYSQSKINSISMRASEKCHESHASTTRIPIQTWTTISDSPNKFSVIFVAVGAFIFVLIYMFN